MQTLAHAISQMNQAKSDYHRACDEVWPLLVATYPEIREILQELNMPEPESARWFCTPHFDDDKSAAELFAEGRGSEVIRLIRRIAYGEYH